MLARYKNDLRHNETNMRIKQSHIEAGVDFKAYSEEMLFDQTRETLNEIKD